MANIAQHVFVSAKGNVADATLVRPSNWNDGHKFVGGVNGNLLVRNTADATYGAAWSTGLTFVSNALANAQGALTADAQAFSSTATWNAAGIAFTHWKANVTDTASAAGSLLLDLQVGGVSKFKVTKTGVLQLPDGTAAAPSLTFTNDTNSGIFSAGDDLVDVSIAGTARFRWNDGEIRMRGADSWGWTSGDITSGIDLFIGRDAPNILTQRNALNAQEFRIENTFTDLANREFVSLGFINNTNVFTIQTEALGGTVRNLALMGGNVGIGTAAPAYLSSIGGPSNGQQFGMQSATTLLSGLSGATATATNLIPAGSVVFGVTIRVTTAITGAASFEIGDGTDPDRWGTAIAIAAGTTTTGTAFTITTTPFYAAATSVVLTANTANFTGGAVRITVHYMQFTAATS